MNSYNHRINLFFKDNLVIGFGPIERGYYGNFDCKMIPIDRLRSGRIKNYSSLIYTNEKNYPHRLDFSTPNLLAKLVGVLNADYDNYFCNHGEGEYVDL